jgi:hypothetical protein
MIRTGSRIAACLVGLFVLVGVARAEAPEDAAQGAAESWLAVVDGGAYAASWDQAARALKSAVKQSEWAAMAEGARAPLGKLGSRKLKSRESTDKMPTTRVIGGKVYSWGQGRYVVLQYESAFANKAGAVETVTAMADPDGAWRVCAYSIH